ncbi:unnamed protein product, partial [Gulo gulo]
GVLEHSGELLSPVLRCNLASSRSQPPKTNKPWRRRRQLQHSCAPWRKSFLHTSQRAGNLAGAEAGLRREGKAEPNRQEQRPAAEWVCARPAVGSEADESHQCLISVPTPDPRPATCPGGTTRWLAEGPTLLRELPSGPARPPGARELPRRNPHQPPLPPAQTKGSNRPGVGEQKTAPRASRVCARRALSPGPAMLPSRAPATRQGCLRPGWRQDPSVPLMLHRRAFTPSPTKFRS